MMSVGKILFNINGKEIYSDIKCSCGRQHSYHVPFLEISAGAIDKVLEAVRVLKSQKPMLVCGPNGWRVAGNRICKFFEENRLSYSKYVFQVPSGEWLEPTDSSLSMLVNAIEADVDLILGVGSGVINDLCKAAGKEAGVPCMIVGTAPSMDGYTSDNSSLIVENVKLSLKEQAPKAIICDTEIMRQAPIHMIHSGLGDFIGKYSSLCDWKLSSIITGEYFCDGIASTIRGALDDTVCCAVDNGCDSLLSVDMLAKGLALSGISIDFAGNSHPASGLEHYFSHAWEMIKLEKGEKYELHGIQVGMGTLITLNIYEYIKGITPNIDFAVEAAEKFNEHEWEKNIRRVFPLAAEGLFEIERKACKNEIGGRIQRAERIISHWDEIVRSIDAFIPPASEVKSVMNRLGMPTEPWQIGITGHDIIDAFVCSPDMRDKYLLSSMIRDIGYTDSVLDLLGNIYCA